MIVEIILVILKIFDMQNYLQKRKKFDSFTKSEDLK